MHAQRELITKVLVLNHHRRVKSAQKVCNVSEQVWPTLQSSSVLMARRLMCALSTTHQPTLHISATLESLLVQKDNSALEAQVATMLTRKIVTKDSTAQAQELNLSVRLATTRTLQDKPHANFVAPLPQLLVTTVMELILIEKARCVKLVDIVHLVLHILTTILVQQARTIRVRDLEMLLPVFNVKLDITVSS